MKKNSTRKMIYMMIIVYLILLVALLIVIFPAFFKVISKELFDHMTGEMIVVFFMSVVICITVLIFMLVGIYQRNNQTENKNVFINTNNDEERSYLEHQIAELNEKMVSTEKRWREAYHLIIASQNRQIDENGTISVRSFLEGFGIDIDSIKIQNDLAFVLTPFHSDYAQTYNVIMDTCGRAKMTCMKGDEEYVQKDLLQHTINYIVKSRVIIANINGRNPNVFYELGIAQTLNKPTILIAHIDTKVPIDLQNQYMIIYTNEEDLRRRLFDVLLKIMTRKY